jgi:uncharacterized protein
MFFGLFGEQAQAYSPVRLCQEMVLEALYHNDWPARLAWRIGSREVRLVERSLHVSRGPDRLNPPLKIAFISDLHVGPTTPVELLERACEMVPEDANIVVIGGDFVYLGFTSEKEEILRRLFGKLPRSAQKFAVLGNHDRWADIYALRVFLAHTEVRLLVNSSVRLKKPYGDIAIVGIDDTWTGEPNIDTALRFCSEAKHLIGVCHSPDGAVLCTDPRFRILLAGHTHGGHVAWKEGHPIIYPPGLVRREYIAGYHQRGPVPVYVSTGLGSTECPFRLNATPEILVLTVV